MTSLILVLAGFAGLLFGGNALVQGAVDLAHRLSVPPLVIGLTLVGFGPSMPELVTSVQAALVGSPGIAIGNVIGSNTVNILLILGLSALVAPMAVVPQTLHRDGTVMLGASVLLASIVLGGMLSRGAGALLVCALLLYVGYTLWASRSEESASTAAPPPATRVWGSLLWLFGGIALTIVAARLLVAGATDIARAAEVSEAVIGLTIVAIGTSLPELVTSVIAARQGHPDMALGNILGSNIFNILGILGATAVLVPLDIPARLAATDIWVMLAATVALLVIARTGYRISRVEGGAMLAGFAAYSGALAIGA